MCVCLEGRSSTIEKKKFAGRPTSSISQMCISSTVLCFVTSLSTPPSPPPTTSTLRDGEEGGGEGEEGAREEQVEEGRELDRGQGEGEGDRP